MQTPSSFPASVSPNVQDVDPDQDDGFNLDAWASNARDPVEYTTTDSTGFDMTHTSDRPSRSSNTPDHERPSWASMKTKAGKDRKRLPLACIACRRKKIKCSGEKPTCQHCAKSRIPCVYKITQRKATPRTDYMAMLDKRLKRMEDRVIRIIPKSQADAVPRAIVKPSAQPHFDDVDESKKRPAGQAFGDTDLDLDGWAAAAERPRSPSRLPRTAFFNRLEHGTAVEGAEALPATEMQEHLAEVYFDYIYGQSYFLLHKPRYMLNLKAGNIPPYLSLAVCAVSARFSSHPQLQTEPAFLRGEDWAKAAQQVAMRYFDTPNIITLIVFMLLSLHGFGACQGGRAFMLSGMAHRMSYSLRLHRDPDHDGLGGDEGIELDFVDREMRRRAMWACFQMDRFTASGNEKPLFAREGYLGALPLPVNEELYMMEVPAPTETLDGTQISHSHKNDNDLRSEPKQNMGVAAYIVKVIVLWGRLLEDMAIGPKPTAEETGASWPSRTSWQALSAALRQFQSELPPAFRYNEENLLHHASAGTAGAFLMLHLIYNHCLLFLHRFAFPVIVGQPSSRIGTSQVLEAARQTALDAADTISDVVGHAQEHRLTVPFGGYVAYVSSAVHLYGAFSKDSTRQKAAKHNLTVNIKYLSRMKKHWGMYHILVDNLKDMYRQYAEAARKGKAVPANAAGRRGIHQYSDWHDKYPQGVSIADYEEILALKPSSKDAQLAEKSDLQSVENWAATRPAYETNDPRRKGGPQKKRARATAAAAASSSSTRRTHPTTDSPDQPSTAQADPQLADRTPAPRQPNWPLSPEQISLAGLEPSSGAGTLPPDAPFMPLPNEPTPPDFPGAAAFGGAPGAPLWPPQPDAAASWTGFDGGGDLMFNEPFMDWNAILNMDMMPGLVQDPAAANADVMWLGDLMQDAGAMNMAGDEPKGQR